MTKGEFEACFAGGLDLSEFTPTAGTTTLLAATTTSRNGSTGSRTVSHSADLLRIKHNEAIMKVENELAEIDTQNSIQIRNEQLKRIATATTIITMPKLPAPTIRSQQQHQTNLSSKSSSFFTTGSNIANNHDIINAVVVCMHQETNKHNHTELPRKMLTRNNNKRNNSSNKKYSKQIMVAKKSAKRKY